MAGDRLARRRAWAQGCSLGFGALGLAAGAAILVTAAVTRESSALLVQKQIELVLGGAVTLSSLIHVSVAAGFPAFPALWARKSGFVLAASWAATLAGLVPAAIGVATSLAVVVPLGANAPDARWALLAPAFASLCVPVIPVWNWTDAVPARPSVDTPSGPL